MQWRHMIENIPTGDVLTKRNTARSNCEYIHEYTRHLIQTYISTFFLLLL